MRRLLSGSVVLIALFAQNPEAVRYIDVAKEAGIKDIIYCGGENEKNYIVETLGAGLAFLDYDNDGYLDLFLVNSSRLEGFPKGEEPTNHLYHNEKNGTI